MAENNSGSFMEERQFGNGSMISPEIVEIGDNSKSFAGSRDGGVTDVYVAVGKDDLDVLKWALDHAVSPGSRVFLVHVFPPVNYIRTPVGKLLRSQLNQEQVRTYTQEDNTRRRNLLQKYIRLCSDFKVVVDTMLIESDHAVKAILELIPVLHITTLVIGTKQAPSQTCHYFRCLRKGMGKGEYLQKNAPDFCEVVLVFNGQKAASHRRTELPRSAERSNSECVGFSGKFN